MIQLKGLCAGYHKRPVISDVDLRFQKETITAIVGPNGSGKSTLLKAVTGLCDIYGGSVAIAGRDTGQTGEKELARKVSYLPQSHTIPAITAGRMVLHGRFPYLSYPRRYRREDYEHCYGAMERMGILPLKDKRMEELSGGERQKVYLAMALAGETQVFLLDEPTTYLDIRCQLELLQIMEKLKGQGKTIVTVLHDLDYAMRVSDFLVVMRGGRVVGEGMPEAVQKAGILEEVFQVKASGLKDELGRKYFFFTL